MDQEQFVNAVKEVVRDSSIDEVVQNLEKPAGRNPDRKLVDLSSWYHNLDVDQKSHLKGVIQLAVDHSIFGLFCVLDGVRPVVQPLDKVDIVFRLSVIEGEKESLLNDPADNYLHDIYNAR